MIVVFTDLDGTLLDHHTYGWTAAGPALQRLEHTGTPCVFVTSKTRAEVEFWRTAMANTHPFIVENGAAAFVPAGYFPGDIPGSVRRGDYVVLEWGTPYPQLGATLDEAAESCRCRIARFGAMSVAEIAADSALSLEQAYLAKQREYDEPFRILDPDQKNALTAEIERRGLRWTEGGRYFHVTGNNDKAVAVRAVTDLYRSNFSEVTTIGLGDGPNDLPFLEAVDRPVIIRSRSLQLLSKQLPHAIVTSRSGPEGWNETILELVPA
jgi:mannosyl-3-phosphoglycerate phosphatase